MNNATNEKFQGSKYDASATAALETLESMIAGYDLSR
jgi:hypothetical protein